MKNFKKLIKLVLLIVMLSSVFTSCVSRRSVSYSPSNKVKRYVAVGVGVIVASSIVSTVKRSKPCKN